MIRSLRSLHPTRITKGWNELKLPHSLRSALQEWNFTAPTTVQSSVIPTAIKGKNVLFSAETGSGKTLAYMLPAVALIKRIEEEESRARLKRPRALILVPSRELGNQVLGIAKELSHHAKFQPRLLSGHLSKQHTALSHSIDLMIATPGSLRKRRQAGDVYLSDLRLIVVDEADTLMDPQFGESVLETLRALQRRPVNRPQLIVATAVPQMELDRVFKAICPDGKRIIMKGAGQVSRANLKESFLPAGGINKTHSLLTALRLIPFDGLVIVFCNTVKSCQFVEHYLREQGFSTMCLHAELPRQSRMAMFQALKSSSPGTVLVSTDLMSRGMDEKTARGVVNFDLPNSSGDYLHRAGRTARAGRRGEVITIVRHGEYERAKKLVHEAGGHPVIRRLDGSPRRIF